MRLKNLLQSNIFYVVLFFLIFFYVYYFINYKENYSLYSIEDTLISGTVIDYKVDSSKVTLTVMGLEKIIVNYYLKPEEIFDTTNLYGANVSVTCSLREATNNTIPNTFNYKEYLYQNSVFYLCSASNIEIDSYNFDLKNVFVNRISKLETSDYVIMFTLGNKSNLSSDIYSIYQSNGIAHLLAISGLHISLFIMVLEKIFASFNKNIRSCLIFIFLFIYAFLTLFAVSVLRCIIFELVKFITAKFNLTLSKVKILFVTASILLLYNPYYIFNIGFQYSFIITFFLLSLKSKDLSKFKSALLLATLSFFASLPITVNMNYEINLSSIMFNLFFVPFISIIVFPLSLLTFIFSFLDKILLFFIYIMEYSSIFCSNYLSIIINIPRMNYIVILIYYALLYLSVTKSYKYSIYLFCCIFYSKVLFYLDNSYYVYYLDIGQGDSTLLVSPRQKEVIMIDTGGNYFYNVSDPVILFLKSIGITEIDLLIITHGDADHGLDTENIYNSINIKKIMLNNNAYNFLELDIINLGIELTDEISYEYFNTFNLNDIGSIDENNASLIFYLKLYNYSFLFPGDAGTVIIESILDRYDLSCDFYKVSHHGSKNNTSERIIESILPSYAFISAGRSNIYNHPNQEVLDILSSYNIKTYLTPTDGTICVKVSKKSYNIFTFPA
ncbi:MAG: DNA internalization-related competence protein ComEC/Rec2 [bacterium]